MLATLSVILSFPRERGVFLKEQASRMYSITSYFMSKVVIEIPWQIIDCGILMVILPFMCNLRYDDEEYVLKLILLFYLCLTGGTALGFFLATFFSSATAAIETVPMVLVIPGLFSGIISNRNDYPKWSGWL